MNTMQRKSLFYTTIGILLMIVFLQIRLIDLMVVHSEYYAQKAKELQERERSLKAERGRIYDRNMEVLADNCSVCTISVIHSQITDPQKVIRVLAEVLNLSEENVRKKVEKNSSLERIKTNVSKETADYLRSFALDGVMVDEDAKRYYPYASLTSKVIGFTGSDNQGVLGLEVKYEEILKGTDGKLLTPATAHGTEIENAAEQRVEPIPGNGLVTTIDFGIQQLATQAAQKVMEAKQAKAVSMILMNPQNGEIYAMVDLPEYDLNHPYELSGQSESTKENRMDQLNQMWRNGCISDTYEPGSTFKIMTAMAALEEGKVTVNDRFYCPGYKLVEDRMIRCHKTTGHGSETFLEGIKNSCNPVFMEIGARVGALALIQNFNKVGLLSKTGIDLPGEATAIMHKTENIKAVELATISFGQSFQITPLELLRSVSAVINGGTKVTPHIGKSIVDQEGRVLKELSYPVETGVLKSETCETMKQLLEAVVHDGTGKRAYLPGFRIGGKTATSEKLPRSSNTYIASFIGFAPADDPQIIALILIDEPQGAYYGGTIAAPVVAEVFDQVLPYLGIEAEYTEEEQKQKGIGQIVVPNVIGMKKEDAIKLLNTYEFGEIVFAEEGDEVLSQFPEAGERINKKSSLILYMK